jgi:hypothetical protein
MSGYTIGEITVWLLLTAVLAFALGWMSRELVLRSRPHEPPAEPPKPVEPAPEPEPEPVEDREAPAPPPAVTPGPHPGSALPLAGGAAPAEEYVIKVSRSSKVYHSPGGSAYARTTAALWFTSAQAAEDAGYRKPKNS